MYRLPSVQFAAIFLFQMFHIVDLKMYKLTVWHFISYYAAIFSTSDISHHECQSEAASQ